MKVCGKYFYGNEISEYGQKNGYVDYRTLAKSFNAVMNNDIIEKTNAAGLGYWEPVGASEDYYETPDGTIYDYNAAQERISEISDEIDEINGMIDDDETDADTDELNARIAALNDEIDALEDARYYDIFQWYIVDDNGAEILKEAGEIVYYNSELDIYAWGVTHWGTSWDYVLTNIRCNTGSDDE